MKKIIVSIALLGTLVACGDKKEAAPKEAAPAGPNLTQVPDVGKVEQVDASASGTGVTPGAAINDALKTAIAQVNGTTIDTVSANVNTFSQATATLDVETSEGKDSAKATATVQGQAFAEQIVSQSKGVVSSFKVVKMTPPTKGGGVYTVAIEARIAKFKAPADAGKIKVVVAPLRSDKATFNIGGREVPAAEVLNPLRQQIIDSLSQTGRFTVLDRQFEGEIANELNMISSGATANTDFAKLSQALSADLIWIGVVNDLAYNKHVRKLQTSDRELVSYSGGWSMSQRMVNVATRQILQSTTLQGTAPSIAPTTMGTGFDSASTMNNMQADMVKKTAEAILLRTFPISIVERDGNNVVLSQGGQAVREQARYKIYVQGKEIKDPQTGQSLGNMESLCCEVVIERVAPNLSYGRLENIKVALDGVQPGALQVRESITAQTKAKEDQDVAHASADDAQKAPNVVPVVAKRESTAKPAASKAASKSEDW